MADRLFSLDENSGLQTGETQHGSKGVLDRVFRVAWFPLLLIALAWSAWVIQIQPLKLFQDIGKSAEFSKSFLHPNFNRLETFSQACLETLALALWGTFLAAVMAVPFGFLGARNTTPHPVIYQLVRRLMDVCRAVNEMVFALMFVAAVGLGPFAGMMAVAIHTFSYLGKLLSETVESIDHGQVEGVSAAGAHRLHVISFGVIPQILPNYLSFVLLRFESNVRSATVVGMVGGGGIGFYLWESLRSFQDQEASAIIIMITLMVIVIDFFSTQVRKRFI